MRIRSSFSLVAVFLTSLVALLLPPDGFASEPTEQLFEWKDLPAIPDPIGRAGMFAGTHNGVLIAAGGANFPDGAPWEGGVKVWHDEIFVLEEPGGEWRTVSTLPRPLAYGISVTTPNGVLCIGGDDPNAFYRETFLLRWEGGEIHLDEMPDLPAPMAYGAGALLETTVYVAGGLSEPEKTGDARRSFWALDLNRPNAGWQELEPWPGDGRFLPAAATRSGAFYLLSGAKMVGEDGERRREYLTDGYRYRPEEGWTPIPNAPRPAVAAPSPAPALGGSHFAVIGGDDGTKAGFEPVSSHPGFPRGILVYNTVTDTWSERADISFPSVVTAPAVSWNGGTTIVSGEVRPGVRTASVRTAAAPTSRNATFGLLNYGTLGIYLFALVIMALALSDHKGSTREFFLGGQRIPWWAAGLSIFGTQLSAITFIAIPAQVYANDWTYILANATILLVAPVVVFCYLPFFRSLNITTVYEYLEKRFNTAVRIFGGAAFCFLQVGRMGIVLFIPAIALATVTGLNLYVSILIMGLLATFYTVLGGIKAVIWTDVLQVIILMGGALLCLFMLIGGIDGGVTEYFATGKADGKFRVFTWSWSATTTAVWVVLLGNFLANLVPYSADQTVVQRYLTTSTSKQAANSIWMNAVLTIPASVIFFGLGTALYVYYKQNPGLMDPHLSGDSVFPMYMAQALPPGVAGLVVAAVFAAAMSSLDSSMNSVATTLVTDYKRFRRGVSEKSALACAQWITLVLGLFGTGAAVLLASFDIRSLWDAYLQILGLFGGSLAGLFVLAIFTQRANGPGAMTGAVASAAILYWVQGHTQLHFFLYGAVGIGSCVAIGYLASFIWRSENRDVYHLTIYSRLFPRNEKTMNKRESAHPHAP